jgi:RNA polymerase sigma-70 factor (ECF subfamily)
MIAAAMSGLPPFEDVYREYLPRIGSFLRAQLGNSTEAEDVTAQVFARAFEAYARFEPRCSTPSAWLFKIARNASLDHRRRSNQRQLAEAAAGAYAANEFEGIDPCQLAETRLWAGSVRRAVATLPERQREVISLRHRLGLTFKEAGARLHCSEDAAKMLYHRGLRALRPMLTEGVAA